LKVQFRSLLPKFITASKVPKGTDVSKMNPLIMEAVDALTGNRAQKLQLGNGINADIAV
jgi:hypothetical protein